MQKSFLICHLGALGDFILTWPALIGLRKIFPGLRFTGVGRAETMRLALRYGLIDGFMDGESRESIGFFSGESLPAGAENPEGAVLWIRGGHFMRERIQETASGPVVLIDPVPDTRIHVSRYYCESIRKQFPIDMPEALSDFFPDYRPAGRSVFIHPGSGSEKKNYSPEMFKKTVEFLRHTGWAKIWMVMGPAEIERGLPQWFSDEKLVFPKDTGSLADYLENASLYIGNDSGVSHLAGYLGIPSIVLYKTTDPSVWGVVGKKVCHVSAVGEEEAYRKLREIVKAGI